MEIFKKSKEDICLLWCWDTVMEETLKESYSDLWEDYVRVVEQYQEEYWGIYQENVDSKMAVALCDAYYGDGCALSQDVVMAEKPVMLQNYDCID